MQRRQFLQLGILLSITIAARQGLSLTLDQAGSLLSPFSEPLSVRKFDGDNEDIPHELLWDKDGALKRLGSPEIIQSHETVIIGGGIAGMTCAYQLKDQDFVLLEQAPQLGGNSKGHWNSDKTVRSIGAAYVTTPDADSSIETFLKELDLFETGHKEAEAPVYFGQDFLPSFKEALSESEQAVYEKIQERLVDIYDNAYPEIPLSSTDLENKKLTLNLDQISFAQWLTQEFGTVPMIIQQFYQMYSWSSFNGSIDEISAAQFLNFITAETQPIWAFPGGNAAIIEKIIAKINRPEKFKTGTFVVDISKTESGYQILFVKDKKLYQTSSQNIIFCAPKFLVDKIFNHEQFADLHKATERIEYRPYVVAQVDLKNEILLPGYDQFILDSGFHSSPSPMKPPQIGFTDIINADWAQSGQLMTRRLTVYKPFPYQGAQQFLFNPMSFDKIEKQIINELDRRAIPSQQIERIAMSRWGHSMPVARVGFLVENALAPLINCKHQNLHFAGQDLCVNPAFESAFETACIAVSKMKS